MTNLNTRQKVFASALVTSVGNWLTFIAIALLIGERFGASKIAYAFLIQSIPPLLFSFKVKDLLKNFNKSKVFISLEIVAAANVLSLFFSNNLYHVYIYLFIATTIRTINNPIFNTFIGEWVPKEEVKLAYTQIGGVSSFTLMLAPVAGAYIASTFGFNFLFFLDAITFLLATIFIFPLLIKDLKNKPESNEPTRSTPKDFFLIPKFNKTLNQCLLIWFWLVIVGAFLNGLEFPVLFDRGLSKEQIGIVLGFWGGGSFLAIFVAKIKKQIPTLLLSSLLTLGIVLFVFSPQSIFINFAFLIAGFANVLISGNIKSNIQHNIKKDENPIQVWSYVNQNVNLINILIYFVLGQLTAKYPLWWMGIALILATIVLIPLLQIFSSKRLQAVKV